MRVRAAGVWLFPLVWTVAGCRSPSVDADSAPPPEDTGTAGLGALDFLDFAGQRRWDYFRGSSERFTWLKAGETRTVEGSPVHWLDRWQSRALVDSMQWSVDPDLGLRVHGHQLGPARTDTGQGEPPVTYDEPIALVRARVVLGEQWGQATAQGTVGVTVLAEEPCDAVLLPASRSCLVVAVDDPGERPWAGTWWFAPGFGPVRWLPPGDLEPWELLSYEDEDRDYPPGGSVVAEPDEVHWVEVKSGEPADEALTLTNVGSDTLEIQDATLTFNGGELFSVRDFDGRVLLPGESMDLILRVSIPSGSLAIATASLRLLTSDPEQPDLRIALFLDSSTDTVVVGVR